MPTRLSTALAILGAALLLSSIEAEGKKLFLSPPTVTLKNYRKEKQKQTNKQKQIHLASVARSVSLRFVFFPGGFSLVGKRPLLLKFVHFPALWSRSFVFSLIHSVQCCVVSLRLSLRCAVHTATYAAAFQEDQLSERGRQLLPPLRTGYLRCYSGSLVRGALACATGNLRAGGCDLGEGTK